MRRGASPCFIMTYEGARTMFARTTEADPDCAMGYWGQAMSFIHPLWSDPPSAADFERGEALVQEAEARGRKSDWERAFMAAAAAYYALGQGASEKPNLAAFENGWQEAYQQFPADPRA